MARLVISIVILSTVYLGCFGNSPSDIQKCSESDPKVNECIVEKANALIPLIAPGDEEKNIPSLSPFEFNKIITDIGSMHLELSNGKVFGIDKTIINNAEFNKEEETITLFGAFPELDLKSDYETSGNIVFLDIEGKGPFKMNLYETNFTCIIKLENLNRESEKPVKVVNAYFDYAYNDGKFHLGNLFHGNKTLGDPVNQLISEQHQAINQEFKPVFIKTVNELVESILKPILEEYSYKDLFEK